MYYLALIITQVLFGLNFPISKAIVLEVDPLKWATIRFLVAGFFLLMITLIFKRKNRPENFKEFFLFVIPIGILGILCGQTFIMFGLKYTASSNAAILTGLIPIIAVILNFIKTGELLTRKKVIGVILAFIGTILITIKTGIVVSSLSLMGDFLVFLGAICVASYFAMGKFLVKRYDHFWVTSFMLLGSGIVLLPYFLLVEFKTSTVLNNLYPEMTFSIFGATLLTYFLSNISLKKIPSNIVSLFIYLQPIVATIAAFIMFDSSITLMQIFSFLLILLGVILCLEKRKKWENH